VVLAVPADPVDFADVDRRVLDRLDVGLDGGHGALADTSRVVLLLIRVLPRVRVGSVVGGVLRDLLDLRLMIGPQDQRVLKFLLQLVEIGTTARCELGAHR
jgi:hypothetical protein